MLIRMAAHFTSDEEPVAASNCWNLDPPLSKTVIDLEGAVFRGTTERLPLIPRVDERLAD